MRTASPCDGGWNACAKLQRLIRPIRDHSSESFMWPTTSNSQGFRPFEQATDPARGPASRWTLASFRPGQRCRVEFTVAANVIPNVGDYAKPVMETIANTTNDTVTDVISNPSQLLSPMPTCQSIWTPHGWFYCSMPGYRLSIDLTNLRQFVQVLAMGIGSRIVGAVRKDSGSTSNDNMTAIRGVIIKQKQNFYSFMATKKKK